MQTYADSVAALPQRRKTPYGNTSLMALLPVGGPENIRQALTANILRTLRGDSADTAPAPASLAALWQQQRQEFARDYQAEIKEEAADMSPDSLPAYSMRHENSQSVQLLCHTKDLLTLGFFSYSYSGGVHGNYGTEAASFDLRTGRRLRYADIFRSAAQTALLPILDRTVRRALKIKPTEPLNEQLLVDTMTVTQNVGLAPGGVVFIYQPYEIASYAQGEIHLFVPLAELRPLLQPGLPVANSSIGKAGR